MLGPVTLQAEDPRSHPPFAVFHPISLAARLSFRPSWRGASSPSTSGDRSELFRTKRCWDHCNRSADVLERESTSCPHQNGDILISAMTADEDPPTYLLMVRSHDFRWTQFIIWKVSLRHALRCHLFHRRSAGFVFLPQGVSKSMTPYPEGDSGASFGMSGAHSDDSLQLLSESFPTWSRTVLPNMVEFSVSAAGVVSSLEDCLDDDQTYLSRSAYSTGALGAASDSKAQSYTPSLLVT